MCAASNDLLKKLELLHRTLDQRKRPEDVATMILESGEPLGPSEKIVREAAKQSTAYSSMSDDFHRSFATLDRQLMLASMLFATDSTVDPEDAKAVSTYLASVEATIGKALGASDYKRDRLNREQRAAIGLGELSRRQYNKRFRLAARMEDKLRRRAREQMKRALTLASKSRLASRLPLSQFVSDPPSSSPITSPGVTCAACSQSTRRCGRTTRYATN